MSVSIAWRSAGEGGAIFASILIDLDATIGTSNSPTTAHPQISTIPQRCGMRLSRGSSTCVAARTNPVVLSASVVRVAAPGSGRAPQHASTAERLQCRAD